MNSYWNRPYFFDKGIYFSCQNCGKCCCGAPGIITVTLENITQIAKFVSDTPYNILKNYTFPYGKEFTIREQKNGCCIFYEQGCRIYPVRPSQCKTYPFWFNNLRSEKKWEQTLKECPGIGIGILYTKEQILSILNSAYP